MLQVHFIGSRRRARKNGDGTTLEIEGLLYESSWRVKTRGFQLIPKLEFHWACSLLQAAKTLNFHSLLSYSAAYTELYVWVVLRWSHHSLLMYWKESIRKTDMPNAQEMLKTTKRSLKKDITKILFSDIFDSFTIFYLPPWFHLSGILVF